MAKSAVKAALAIEGQTALMERHADALPTQLQAHHLKVFPPTAEKAFAPSVHQRLLNSSKLGKRISAQTATGP